MNKYILYLKFWKSNRTLTKAGFSTCGLSRQCAPITSMSYFKMYLLLIQFQELPFSIQKHTHAAYFMRLFQEFCLQSDYRVKMLMLQLYNSATNFYHFPLYLSLDFLSFIYHITRRFIVIIIRHHHHNYQEYYSQFLTMIFITIIAINLNICVNIIIYIKVFVLIHDLTFISIAIKTITIIIIDIVFIVTYLPPSLL